MCPGRCARCVGIALVPLALIAIPASVILLFPNGEREYLTDAHITWVALFLPGLWGSGFMMFVSVIYAQLAIIGSATCFGSSALGLIKGPLCLFNTTLSNKTQVQLWDYPFHDRNRSSSAESYLSDPSLWAICEKPKNIVLWNTVLFCTLMVISCLEVLLCTMQIINGLLGCIFGRC
ncbi:transmembrane 4 L6 family member 1-like isoform X2 [Heterodontus francisci]|uniref:transmembrane 4 L6 family member 1-like isoform X2 n=1 Tax=Heterodontus francisci TaxID=7792 RepID=UPI00355C6058